MPVLQHLDRLELKAKKVLQSALFRPNAEELRRTGYGEQLVSIRRSILGGVRLDDWRYRRSGYEVPVDKALRDIGLMHLHLSPSHGDKLLWLLQYDTFVIFLEISGHEAFGSDPPGSSVLNFHSAAINKIVKDEAAQEAAKKEALRTAVDKLRRTHIL